MDPNSTVEGQNVKFNAHAGDSDTLTPGSFGDLRSEDQLTGMSDPLALKLPLSVIYKQATAHVTLDNSTTIQASGLQCRRVDEVTAGPAGAADPQGVRGPAGQPLGRRRLAAGGVGPARHAAR
jgi:hypothetical protein